MDLVVSSGRSTKKIVQFDKRINHGEKQVWFFKVNCLITS